MEQGLGVFASGESKVVPPLLSYASASRSAFRSRLTEYSIFRRSTALARAYASSNVTFTIILYGVKILTALKTLAGAIVEEVHCFEQPMAICPAGQILFVLRRHTIVVVVTEWLNKR